MATKITKTTDFVDIVCLINEAAELLRKTIDSETQTRVIDVMKQVSEVILDSGANPEDIQAYSRISVSAIENMKKNISSTKREFEAWMKVAKEMLSVLYINVAANQKYGSNLAKDDSEKAICGFFDVSDNANITTAHLFSVLAYARRDARYCYDEILSVFGKKKDVFSSLYKNITYVYDPTKIEETIHERCPVCDSAEAEPYFCACQAMLNDNRFSPAKLWMKCGGCGNLYAYNFPTMKNGEINGHYTRKNEDGILENRHLLNIYGNIFNSIKHFNDGKKYLEIGVGNGEMLAVALEMGYDVSAVEICKEDCENISGALGVDIKWTDFAYYETDEKYDVIIMGDVIEHVIEPIKILEKAVSLLNDGGILWLSTPNYDSAITRMRKFTDAMWNQKNHFTYFSYDNLLPFIEKVGLTVKQYDVSARYNGSMELILQKN